ncbi:MAG: hypothetical protein A3C50_00210 [Candidatus Staskawiczbacteria bacterium RIFCSPHIGHO2_02_FULL_43_16]|uniref:Uncharacterized protein n=1 Tax=Candidatus Staskawiczbacteria bacterium RIFCSPHIGHO2_01_FULL_41_41 TaxID=1802203 RepID=A0A1G2HXA0_9BACT|nr:MAG: hypothetical protein A2822_01875 [Candidatus Staskawiczbacteria bacterium RIFCSPHIGHO2_01_FULL_41_41]OGZ68913.1 MAG: hypothetical protein A3C50_00210 [Candidatus Staskawiczbacteria bacterium RIFCSPHIGHO2_02_FULL_43_16]
MVSKIFSASEQRKERKLERFIKRKNKLISAAQPPSGNTKNPKPWTFFCRLNGLEEALPPDKEGFVKKLAQIMANANYQNLNPTIVYKKLCGILEMEVAQRQMIGKAIDHRECKKWSVGKHRVFFAVDESNRIVRISFLWRKDAYGGH